MFLKELEGVWMNLLGVTFKTSQSDFFTSRREELVGNSMKLPVGELNSYQSQIRSTMGQWEENP